MGFLQEYEASSAADVRQAVLRKWIGLRRQELFAELRAQQPIFETPDFILVTRHQDVAEVFSHQDLSVAPYREAGSINFVLGLDNPEHDPVRARLEQTLQWTQKQLTQDRPRIHEIVTAAAARVIDAARPRGQLDLPAQFGRHVPLQVVADYFGVPDVERVGDWTRDLFRAVSYSMFGQYVAPNPLAGAIVKAKAEQARQEFFAYVVGLVERSSPGASTLIERMRASQGDVAAPLAIPAIARDVVGLINGMIDNINVFLTNAMAELLSRPQELADAVAAARDKNIPRLRQYLWEALRFNAYPFALPRLCHKPHVLGTGTAWETPIPAGKRVFAVIGSAMMDETVIRDPEHFHLDRPEEQYLYFGPGSDIHVCVGKAIAEILLVAMAKSLLVLEDIRRADGPAGELQYEEGLLKGFTIAFGPASRSRISKTLARTSPEPVQHPLTAIMTIKQPVEIHANALKLLLAEKFTSVKALLDRVGTIHFARFVFLDNDSKLALITTYDGSFDNYIKNYIELAGELFDAMLAHMQGAPPLPVRQYRQEFIDYVRHVDLTAPERVSAKMFYSAYPTLTVQSVRVLEKAATVQNNRIQEETPITNLDLADIQGLILRNYHMPMVRHFILRIDNAREARRFIAGLVNPDQRYPQITTAAAEWQKGKEPEYCLNIGFTYAGLQALKLPDSSLESFAKAKAFVEGTVARAQYVGDTGENAPDRWDEALRKPDDMHVLLSLYAGGDKELKLYTDTLEDLFTRHALKNLQPYDGKALPGGRIHFGYKDGISQPTIAGAPKPEFPDSQPLVPPGAFLLGYPSQWKDFRYPVPRPPELGRNGSFMAFRILEQDVAAFEQYLKETVAEQKTKYPEIDLDEEKLAAKICGRWRNGVPLVLSPDSPNTKIPKEQWNSFTYAKDKEGYGCPFGSHMRRTNPRGDMVAGADGHQHRIIRRGMPYGPPYDEAPNEKRGLLGLFICVSLEDQFEFLMTNWINGGGFRPEVPTGATDPMIGNNEGAESQFIIPTRQGPVPLQGFSRFVTTRGGAYCFLPSLTALRYIARLED